MTMPDATKPRKPNRLWLFAPYALVLIALAGWSAYWLHARDRIEAGLAAAAKPGGRQTITYSSHTIGGFPFRYVLGFKDAKVSEASGWGIAAPELQVEIAAYDLDHLVAVAPRGLTLMRPEKGPIDVAGDSLRASIGGLRSRLRFGVEAKGLRLTTKTGDELLPLAAASLFRVNLVPQTGDLAQFFVQLDNATPTPGTALARVADGPASLKLAAVISHSSALVGANWPDVMRHWSAASGDMVIDHAEAAFGPVKLSTDKSGLAVDEDGRLRGKIDLKLSEGSSGMMALGATGVLPPETAAVGAGLAGSSAHFALKFKNGETLVGPLPIGKAPRLY